MTTDEYISAQPEEIREILISVSDMFRDVLPDAEERFSYQMPTWWRKHNLIHFAAQKKHLGIYPGPDAIEAFKAELDQKKLKYSKGAIQFPYDRIDLGLIRRIAEWCGRRY